jgi:hypothetical protein
MFSEKPLTLGAAERLIESYLEEQKELSIEEKAILYEIQNRCSAIGHQKGWLKGSGLLANYWARKDAQGEIKEKLTEQALIEESKKIHLHTVNYTIHALKQLKNDIESNQFVSALFYTEDSKKPEESKLFKLTEKHHALLSKISECLEAVLSATVKDRSSVDSEVNESEKRENWSFTEDEIKFFECKKEDFRLAERLHAVFYPFAQKFDPLGGQIKKEQEEESESIPEEEFLENEDEKLSERILKQDEQEKEHKNKKTVITPFAGACHGHVLVAMQEIQKSGKNLSLPRYDKETLLLFESQYNLQQFASYPQKSSVKLEWEHTNIDKEHEDIAQKIESFFNIILTKDSREYIYAVQMTKPGITGHIATIRCIPSTSEIEYNDSNLGLFVFPTIDAFNYWFSQQVIREPQFYNGAEISLLQIGKQPELTSASIPIHDVITRTEVKRDSKAM